MKHKLPERLKELREKKGLSQVELATDLNLSSGFVGDIERGASSISIETLMLIADYFDVTTDYMLGFNE